VNTNFGVTKRRRATRQVDNGESPIYSGDIIVRDMGGNLTMRAVSYVIPSQALALAQDSNPNFTGQYSVVHFRQNLLSSDLNISQVNIKNNNKKR